MVLRRTVARDMVFFFPLSFCTPLPGDKIAVTDLRVTHISQQEHLGAFLTYSRARAGTDNPPSIDCEWEQKRGRGISGVPHLSSNKVWARFAGTHSKGISWAKNLEWMALAVREGNEGVMQGLQEMWDSDEEGLVVVHGDIGI